MDDQNVFINYLAYISDSKKLSTELDNMNSVIIAQYEGLELSLFNRLLSESLIANIGEKEVLLHSAFSLGTTSMAYDFNFNGQRYIKDLGNVIKTWKFTLLYLEEVEKIRSKPKLLFKIDDLPDLLNYDQVNELTGWTKKTIQTKHSKGELLNSGGFTYKQGLIEYFSLRIKGAQINPEAWFTDNILKKIK